MEHTPGPWKADEAGYGDWRWEGGYRGTIVAANGDTVYAGPASFAALKGKTVAQAEANARLIAAAPELLEACQEVRILLNLDEGPLSSLNRQAASARLWLVVAKATGGE